MREVVLDTETTGFEPNEGDRIVEIGAVELLNHLPTGRTYHQYINPKRNMPEAAFNVHGLSEEFLSNKPVFKDIAQEFIDFIKDSKLVIHNALCRRFGIDNSSRTLHGALLDSEILAEVYLELVGGRQPDLILFGPEVKTTKDGAPSADWRPAPRPKPLASRLSETEKAAHETFIAALGADALWLKET